MLIIGAGVLSCHTVMPHNATAHRSYISSLDPRYPQQLLTFEHEPMETSYFILGPSRRLLIQTRAQSGCGGWQYHLSNHSGVSGRQVPLPSVMRSTRPYCAVEAGFLPATHYIGAFPM